MTTLEFNALVRQYQGLVYTVCHQLVPDEGDAQDLAQETFLAAWRAIDRCPPGYEKQWLARIASNKAKDYLRSAWVRRVNTPGDDILALEGAPPGSVPHPLPPDAAGGPHRRRGGSPLRQAPKDGGGADLPGKENAGGADPSGKEERRWNCFVKMAA